MCRPYNIIIYGCFPIFHTPSPTPCRTLWAHLNFRFLSATRYYAIFNNIAVLRPSTHDRNAYKTTETKTKKVLRNRRFSILRSLLLSRTHWQQRGRTKYNGSDTQQNKCAGAAKRNNNNNNNNSDSNNNKRNKPKAII